jgi:hypothetical protein
MTEQEELEDMKLHETKSMWGHVDILRVLGGYIYTTGSEVGISSVFVPDNN